MIKQLVGGLAVAALVVGASASAHAACDFQHPSKAKKFQGYFVQAMVSCGNVGGNNPNSQAGGAVPACKPPETFNEKAGSPAAGWLWGPKSQMSIQFKASKKPAVASVTPADSSDLTVQLKGKDIQQQGGVLVDGETGQLHTLTRTTLDDRTNGSVTVVDFALDFNFPVFGGKIKYKTSADQQLNAPESGGLAGLPHCTSIQNLETTVRDQLGHDFGGVGLFLP